jgi:hypothetical protein
MITSDGLIIKEVLEKREREREREREIEGKRERVGCGSAG